MKIHNTSGSLYTFNNKGERVRVESFTAPTDNCDCGIFCCGDEQVIRYRSATTGKMRQMNLDAVYDLVPAGEKKEY